MCCKLFKSLIVFLLAINLLGIGVFGLNTDAVDSDQAADLGNTTSNDSGSITDSPLIDASARGILPWLELAGKAKLSDVSLEQFAKAIKQPLILVDNCLLFLDVNKNSLLAVSSAQAVADKAGNDSGLRVTSPQAEVSEARFSMKRLRSGVIYASNLPYRVYWMHLNRSGNWAPEWIFALLDSKGQVLRMAALGGSGKVVLATTMGFDPRESEADSLAFLKRYVAYRAKNGAVAQLDVIRALRLNLDRKFYEGIRELDGEQARSVAALVNKFYRLPATYKPTDLVAVDKRWARNGWQYWLRADAYAGFLKMREAARANGLRLVVVSAFRSYSTQGDLYAAYVRGAGQVAADQFSARAGHSEHQTGLALDIASGTGGAFGASAEYRWLKANAHRYGFVLRYPQGKTAVTGYMYEPWHWRYVGVELASAIQAEGLTLEEFLNK